MNTNQPYRQGRIIFLNGASSSGKSTLSKALQVELNEPFLHVASDHLALGLPARRDPGGPFQWWGHQRLRFFEGFHRSIAALALGGNDLIVDHIIEFPAWRSELRHLLQAFDVFLVGVHCDMDELERRERVRGDRQIGEGRSHVVTDGIHTFGAYDYVVDTTNTEPTTVARNVLEYWQRRTTSVLFSENPAS